MHHATVSTAVSRGLVIVGTVDIGGENRLSAVFLHRMMDAEGAVAVDRDHDKTDEWKEKSE